MAFKAITDTVLKKKMKARHETKLLTPQANMPASEILHTT
jgi:hypothetical protein